MSRLNLYILVFVICASVKDSFAQTSLYSNGQDNRFDTIITETSDDMVIYKIFIPPNNSKGIFLETPLEIKKDKVKPTFLLFQPGGDETNIRIVDSSHVGNANNKDPYDWPVISKLDFDIRSLKMLEITDLKTGTYFVLYSSCAIGGRYKMHLIE